MFVFIWSSALGNIRLLFSGSLPCHLLWEISDSCFLNHYPGFRGHLLFTESLLLNTWDTNHRSCTCLPCHMTNKLVLLFRAILYYFQILIEGSSYKLILLCLWFGVLFLSMVYGFCLWFLVLSMVYGFCVLYMDYVHGSWSLAMVHGFSPWFMVLVIFVHGFGFCSWFLAMIDGFGPWFMVTYCRVTSGENELVWMFINDQIQDWHCHAS